MNREGGDAADAAYSDRSGVLMGKYRLIAHLGTGGMADVHLAVAKGALDVNKLVVIKRLHDEQAREETSREMFLNEARLAARLNHANVVQTSEAGSDQGHFYLVMEYVEGQPLSRVLANLRRKSSALAPLIAARVLADALTGLHYAHDLCDFDGTPLDIVHRDVSPQNIMITYDGAVKILDFGIAKVVGSDQTAHGVFKGKVAYMSPEQVLCQMVDRRADVFAAGIVLWEAVTGQRLMADDLPAKTLYNVMSKIIPRPSTIRAVPAALDAVIVRALDRDPAARYQTAREMRDALEAFITQAGGFRNEAIGDYLRSMFAETRDKTRSLVRDQLAELSFARSGVSSMTRLSGGPEIIDLAEGDESTGSTGRSRQRPTAAAGISIVGMVAPPRPNRLRAIGVALALVVAGGGGAALLMRSTTPPAASPPPLPVATPATAVATPPPVEAKPVNSLQAPSDEASQVATAAAKAKRERPAAPAHAAAAQAPVPHASPPIVEAPPPPPVAAPPAPKPAHSAAQEPPQGRTFRREL
ncbi:MAG TPA: serine/threonine-protein kinase [Polyangiaceae bacterium]|nr:serine/threonine-protein kinase [Polyangiaceae bacterium]